MKTKNLFSVLLLTLLAACAGVAARDRALTPAMGLAWPRIEAEVLRGVDAQDPPLSAEQAQAIRDDAAAVGAALGAGDRAALFPIDWLRLHEMALDGINDQLQDGEIGVGVAQSKLERLRLFSESMVQALSR